MSFFRWRTKNYCLVFEYHLDMFISLPARKEFFKNYNFLTERFLSIIQIFFMVEISLYIIIRYNVYKLYRNKKSRYP